MDFHFLSNDGPKELDHTIEEAKKNLNLVVKSTTRVFFEDKITGEEFVCTELTRFLEAANLKISQIETNKETGKNDGESHIVVHGNVSDSNFVIGNNNTSQRRTEGFTVIIKGNNLSVTPITK